LEAQDEEEEEGLLSPRKPSGTKEKTKINDEENLSPPTMKSEFRKKSDMNEFYEKMAYEQNKKFERHASLQNLTSMERPSLSGIKPTQQSSYESGFQELRMDSGNYQIRMNKDLNININMEDSDFYSKKKKSPNPMFPKEEIKQKNQSNPQTALQTEAPSKENEKEKLKESEAKKMKMQEINLTQLRSNFADDNTNEISEDTQLKAKFKVDLRSLQFISKDVFQSYSEINIQLACFI
jgi:hypothetical protein